MHRIVSPWKACLLIVTCVSMPSSGEALAGSLAPFRLISLGSQAAPLDLALLADGSLAAVGTWGKYPALWTVSGTSAPVGTLLRDGNRLLTGQASRISDNGEFIAGWQYTRTLKGGTRTAGRVWQRPQPSAPSKVPPPLGPFRSTSVFAVTDDGRAVGEAGGYQTPIQWSAGSGSQYLPGPGGGITPGAAKDVSADGLLAVGDLDLEGVRHAVRWTPSSVQILDARSSQASAISPHGRYSAGSVLVSAGGGPNFVPAYWDETSLHLLPADVAGNPLVGTALWVTDAGVVGGMVRRQDTFQPAGWLAFPGKAPLFFEDWWLAQTGSPFPVSVVGVNSAVQVGNTLHFAIAGGTGYQGYLASVEVGAIAAAVPEPGSLALAVLAAGLLVVALRSGHRGRALGSRSARRAQDDRQ